MRRFVLTLILFFCVTTLAPAAEVCKTVNITSYTQKQKNLIKAAGYRLMFEAGDDRVPTRWSNKTGEICFEDPQVNLNSVLSNAKMLTQINQYIFDATPTQEKTNAFGRTLVKRRFQGQNVDALALRCLVKVLVEDSPVATAQAIVKIDACIDDGDADQNGGNFPF